MKLTVEEEAYIADQVSAHHFKIKSLEDDLVDHICCVVESQLGKDKSFEVLVKEAIADLAPNGLDELEHKTIFLLNAKRILLMKKLIYLSGFIGSVTLSLGLTFKILHWPYGYELFSIGIIILLLLFVPLLVLDIFKVALSKSLTEKTKIILGTLAAITTGLAALFKIMHLQGAEVLLLLGTLLFTCGFLPFLFFTMYKKSLS